MVFNKLGMLLQLLTILLLLQCDFVLCLAENAVNVESKPQVNCDTGECLFSNLFNFKHQINRFLIFINDQSKFKFGQQINRYVAIL